jgi:hypothetical protein
MHDWQQDLPSTTRKQVLPPVREISFHHKLFVVASMPLARAGALRWSLFFPMSVGLLGQVLTILFGPAFPPNSFHCHCHSLLPFYSMKKWSILQYHSKKLPDGKAVPVPVSDRENPGTDEYDIDVSGLTQLQEEHRENMLPLQIVACFILQHIHMLAFQNLVESLFLTRHHGLPVAKD